MEFIKVVLSLKNPFDHEEYKAAMEAAGLHVASISNFAQVVGWLSVAMVKYPDMTPEDAYMQFIDDMNNPVVAQVDVNQPAKTGCGSCGGGKTR